MTKAGTGTRRQRGRAKTATAGFAREIKSPRRDKSKTGLSKTSLSKPISLKSPGHAVALAAPAGAGDDVMVIALSLPATGLSESMAAYFAKCEEKLGFVPNVLKAYAFDMAKLESFVAMYNDLMLAPSGLSKLEREMIAVAVSSYNRCFYCLVSHGAAIRQYSGDPILGELIAMNYRAEVSNGLIEDEITHIFIGRFDGAPVPDPLEVSDWCWKPFGEVEQDVDARPDIYTIWFRKIRNEYWSDIIGALYGSGVEPKPPMP